MLSQCVTCLRLTAPMWFDCTKTALTNLKVAYNNSLRQFVGLPWHNSASKMLAKSKHKISW